MMYIYSIPSKEYYFGVGGISYNCETRVLYYANHVSGEHIIKHNASLRNFRILVKSLNGTKRTISKFWKKPYYER